ncbi:hypothetical protein EVAR_68697_1 [Eumeta japonica]|uniref:Uncharacterized protein n=1 Tax=Eumeta variegata TaxID=151549 RepID=A0A4C2A415_EUMVA|nr:hypothetical protein EVAR_68697_1 [Eumeta japonica]
MLTCLYLHNGTKKLSVINNDSHRHIDRRVTINDDRCSDRQTYEPTSFRSAASAGAAAYGARAKREPDRIVSYVTSRKPGNSGRRAREILKEPLERRYGVR